MQFASPERPDRVGGPRGGELIGRRASQRLGVPFGIVDLSLAPTPAQGDSVARILESMGLERVGAHGSTAALALLNDAVKKGGAMASSHVGGLSGAFIPVSEDIGMIEAAAAQTLSFDKLEAMTCVCSVGLDMVAIPGDTPAETLAAIIADESAIGMINRKTTAVRVIPVPGKRVGEWVEQDVEPDAESLDESLDHPGILARVQPDDLDGPAIGQRPAVDGVDRRHLRDARRARRRPDVDEDRTAQRGEVDGGTVEVAELGARQAGRALARRVRRRARACRRQQAGGEDHRH